MPPLLLLLNDDDDDDDDDDDHHDGCIVFAALKHCKVEVLMILIAVGLVLTGPRFFSQGGRIWGYHAIMLPDSITGRLLL